MNKYLIKYTIYPIDSKAREAGHTITLEEIVETKSIQEAIRKVENYSFGQLIKLNKILRNNPFFRDGYFKIEIESINKI